MIHTLCVMSDWLNRPKPYGPVSIWGNVQRVCWDGVFTTIENCYLFCLFRLFCIWVFRANVHMIVHSFRPFATMMAWLVQYHPEVRSLVLHTSIFFRETSFVAPSITYSTFVWTLNELLLIRVFWNVLNWNLPRKMLKMRSKSIDMKSYLWQIWLIWLVEFFILYLMFSPHNVLALSSF